MAEDVDHFLKYLLAFTSHSELSLFGSSPLFWLVCLLLVWFLRSLYIFVFALSHVQPAAAVQFCMLPLNSVNYSLCTSDVLVYIHVHMGVCMDVCRFTYTG